MSDQPIRSRFSSFFNSKNKVFNKFVKFHQFSPSYTFILGPGTKNLPIRLYSGLIQEHKHRFSRKLSNWLTHEHFSPYFLPDFPFEFFFFNDPQRSYDDKTRVLHIRNNSIRVQSETVSIIIAHAELEFGHKTYLRPNFFLSTTTQNYSRIKDRI